MAVILGSHVSVAGGPANAFLNAKEIGGDAAQIFVKPPRKLRGIKPFSKEQIAAWEESRKASRVREIVVHGNYLINLAGEGHVAEYSREAFLDEMKRCHELQVAKLIFHPGKYLELSPEQGLKNIAKNLQWCLKKGKDFAGVTILLENMAGTGSNLGDRFEQLRQIMDLTGQPERFGVCIDTCHTLAAGYDLRTPDAYAKTMEQLDATVGLDRVMAFHLNDSKAELGSRIDRHAEIGKGYLGTSAFKLLLQDVRWRDVPGVLETPHEDNAGFAKDLGRLRRCEKEPLGPKDFPKQRTIA
jgi:deoxyribonuclease-4